jgi:hypothetical protein
MLWLLMPLARLSAHENSKVAGRACRVWVMHQGKPERVLLTVPHAFKWHLFCLSISETFRHYLIATAGLVNLRRTRRLEDSEQFAFAS